LKFKKIIIKSAEKHLGEDKKYSYKGLRIWNDYIGKIAEEKNESYLKYINPKTKLR